jgi:hypothetical protein
MIRTQIQLHSKQVQWLKKYGLTKGMSMAQVIRDSVDFYRLHIEKSEILNLKKNKALKAVGAFTTEAKERREEGEKF